MRTGDGNSLQFNTAYSALERRMRALAEADGDVYLPNPEPAGAVDYLLICMEPSLGGWARSPDAARARVDAGFRNFLAGLEPMLLHFCVRRFLCAPGQGYYITDFSKGAMHVKRAGVLRAERYRRWFSLLEEEIDLVAAPGAGIIAVGKTVADALRRYRLQRPFTQVMHYSPLAAKSRAVRLVGLEKQFEAFERTVSHADVLATAHDVLKAAGVPPSIYEDAESIVRKVRLTTSHRKLIFAYKLAFEQLTVRGFEP